MQENFKRYGYVSMIDELTALVKDENFGRRSLRESVPNQVHTRNIIGLYNVLDDIQGFGDYEMFTKYYVLLKDVSDAIIKEYGYSMIEYRSLMLVKLFAGKSVDEHTDEAGIYKYSHRVHIPIITNEKCIFTIDGEEGRISTGEMVEINNTVPHSVLNGGSDRVHIIVDIVGVHDGFDEQALGRGIPEQYYLKGV